MEIGDKFTASEVIKMVKKCRLEERISEEEAYMLASVLAKQLNLEIKIEEYKFRLNER